MKPHTTSAEPAAGPGRPDPRSTWLTYEGFYGLTEKPFSLSSDPRFFYHSESHTPAFDELLAGILRRESLSVLTGDIGMGKTTLCRAVIQSLDRKTFSAIVPDPFATREDLLKVLLMDFGVMSIDDLTSGRLKGASRTELSYLLYEFLDTLAPLQAFAVVIIDEAQNLSVPLLEEIRILSDSDGRDRQLQVVLVGQLELRDKLMLREMRQVDQRVSVRSTLDALTRDGVAGYIKHRLEVAGAGPAGVRFTRESIDLIHRQSGGVPRLINRICDRALYEGYLRRAVSIDEMLVDAVIAGTPRASAHEEPAPRPRSGQAPAGIARAVETAPPVEPVPPVFAEPESPRPGGPEGQPLRDTAPGDTALGDSAQLDARDIEEFVAPDVEELDASDIMVLDAPDEAEPDDPERAELDASEEMPADLDALEDMPTIVEFAVHVDDDPSLEAAAPDPFVLVEDEDALDDEARAGEQHVFDSAVNDRESPFVDDMPPLLAEVPPLLDDDSFRDEPLSPGPPPALEWTRSGSIMFPRAEVPTSSQQFRRRWARRFGVAAFCMMGVAAIGAGTVYMQSVSAELAAPIALPRLPAVPPPPAMPAALAAPVAPDTDAADAPAL